MTINRLSIGQIFAAATVLVSLLVAACNNGGSSGY
jgi:predicted small secreted protein